jgi:hypothetical protein
MITKKLKNSAKKDWIQLEVKRKSLSPEKEQEYTNER